MKNVYTIRIFSRYNINNKLTANGVTVAWTYKYLKYW